MSSTNFHLCLPTTSALTRQDPERLPVIAANVVAKELKVYVGSASLNYEDSDHRRSGLHRISFGADASGSRARGHGVGQIYVPSEQPG
jgi:hypothetical protein